MSHDLQVIKIGARGRWKQILTAAGIPSHYLTNKHGPCPFCDGVDRWRWDDKYGDGTGFCNQCNATGDGFHLVAKAKNLDERRDFAQILEFVANQIGHNTGSPNDGGRGDKERQEDARKIWNEAVPLSQVTDSPVHQYLQARGLSLTKFSPALRFHRSLPAFVKGTGWIGNFPAMVAGVFNASGVLTGIHRTYLSPVGKKVSELGDDVKKCLG
jgi:putative DNA primase/helicase